ncbi:MAG: carbohydrate kinase family protein [Ignavibacteriaceae bacterium]|nr:carbohydrate kinase family protein [Ignavibacteriaceae bacterium]
MKLMVIGHTVEDHVYINGKDIIKPGGIFYTAIGLKNFIDKEDTVLLNTFVQKENYDLFAGVYDELGKDNLKFVERIPKVYLTLHDFKERGETYESISQNLDIEIKNLNNSDGILINMITGFDITLNQLKEIRQEYKGLIFMDVHTLSRGLDENLKRNFRPIPIVDEWISSVDILQANVNELKTISDKTDEKDAAEEILRRGVKIFILTKGEIGARVFTLNNNEIISIFKSSIKIGNKNMIGCGDIFGAVFFYTYIKTRDLYKSLEFANTAAGYTASYEDINAFNGLKNDVFTRYN